jgi:hypothetical protein
MRVVILASLAILALLASAPAAPALAGSVSAAYQAQPDLNIDIDIDEGGAWYTNPLWIGIGVVGIIAIIAVIVAASRGGTTVVKGP